MDESTQSMPATQFPMAQPTAAELDFVRTPSDVDQILIRTAARAALTQRNHKMGCLTEDMLVKLSGTLIVDDDGLPDIHPMGAYADKDGTALRGSHSY